MADNIALTINADIADVRAKMAVAGADVRAYRSEINRLATDMRSASGTAKASIEAHLQNVAGLLANAEAKARNYSRELKEVLHPEGGGLSGMLTGAAEEISGLTGGLGAVKGAMAEIAEAAGVAFAVDRLGEWLTQTAEAGEKAVNMAAAVGMSTGKYLEFAGAMRLSGGDAEAASRTLERLARNVGDALNNPVSRARMSFKALGISLDELRKTGGDVTEVLRLIIGRADEFAPSMSRTANVMALTGRGMNELAGMLREGAAGFDENIEKTKELGAANAEYAREQAESAKQVNTLRLSVNGLSDELFHDLKPAFDDALVGLTDFTQDARQAALAANEFLAPLGGISGTLKEIGKVVTSLGMPALLTGALTGDWKKMLLGPLAHAWDEPEPISASATLPDVEVKGKKVAPWPDKAGGKGNQEYEAFAANERLKIAEAQGDVAKIEAIYAEWLARAAAAYGQDSKQYREVQLAKVNFEKEAQAKRFAILEEGVSADISAGNRSIAAFKNAMGEMVTERKITGEQAIGFEIEKAQQIYDANSAALQKLYGEMNETPAQQARVNKMVEALDAEHLAMIAGLNRDYTAQAKAWADAFAAPWKSAADQIGSALEHAFNSAVIKGGKGAFGQAMVQLRQSVEGSVLGAFEGAASKAAAGPLAKLLGQGSAKPGEGVGDVIGNAASDWIGKQISNLIPNLGAQAATSAASAVAITTPITAAIAAQTATLPAALAAAMTATVTTPIVAALAVNTANPEVLGTKLAGGGFVPNLFSRGGSVPAAAAGWRVPASFGTDTTPAMLTPHETVLPVGERPSHIAAVLGSKIDALGTSNGSDNHFHAHFHGPADAPAIQRWFKDNLRGNSDALARMVKSGALGRV